MATNCEMIYTILKFKGKCLNDFQVKFQRKSIFHVCSFIIKTLFALFIMKLCFDLSWLLFEAAMKV